MTFSRFNSHTPRFFFQVCSLLAYFLIGGNFLRREFLTWNQRMALFLPFKIFRKVWLWLKYSIGKRLLGTRRDAFNAYLKHAIKQKKECNIPVQFLIDLGDKRLYKMCMRVKMAQIQCFFSQTLHTAVAHEHSSVHQSLADSTELSAASQPNPAPGYYLLQTARSETIHFLHKRGSEILGKPEYFKSQCARKRKLFVFSQKDTDYWMWLITIY